MTSIFPCPYPSSKPEPANHFFFPFLLALSVQKVLWFEGYPSRDPFCAGLPGSHIEAMLGQHEVCDESVATVVVVVVGDGSGSGCGSGNRRSP